MALNSDSTDNNSMIAWIMMKKLVLMKIMTLYNCVKGNNDSVDDDNNSKNKAKLRMIIRIIITIKTHSQI